MGQRHGGEGEGASTRGEGAGRVQEARALGTSNEGAIAPINGDTNMGHEVRTRGAEARGQGGEHVGQAQRGQGGGGAG